MLIMTQLVSLHLVVRMLGYPQDAERSALRLYAADGHDGFYDLVDFLARGIALIGMWPDSGAPLEPPTNPQNSIRDVAELRDLWEGRGNRRRVAEGKPIRSFVLIPGYSGYICLDLDPPGDGRGGSLALRTLFMREGASVPAEFASPETGSFPAYTRSSSGRLHLYFRYPGLTRYPPQSIAPGVSVVHVDRPLFSPGSETPTDRYLFFGSLARAPLLPPLIERTLETRITERAKELPPSPSVAATRC